MSPQEHQQFKTMQGDIEQIKQSQVQQGKQMDKIAQALLGNEIGKDGGLVGRIEDLEKELTKTKIELETVKQEAAKSRWHLNIVYLCCGAVAMGILGQILTFIFKK